MLAVVRYRPTNDIAAVWRRLPAPPPLLLRRGWLSVAVFALVVYATTTFLTPRLGLPPEIGFYLVDPLCWMALCLGVDWLWRADPALPSARFDRWLVGIAGVVALMQIAVTLAAGLMGGFGNSPYSHGIATIFNVWYIGTRLVAIELARWYVLCVLARRNLVLGFAASWALASLLTIPFNTYGQMNSALAAAAMGGSVLIPTMSENLLATYLSLVGGPLAAITYRGLLEAFQWLSPILPNVRWTLTAFIGTVAPVLGLLAVHDIIRWKETKPADDATDAEKSMSSAHQSKTSSWGIAWVFFALVALSVFWMNTGLFGIRPSLISGVSMQPGMYVGDIAVTRSVPASDIKVGDIIRFKQGNSSILHRVIAINKDTGGQLTFTTKGDNNNTIDPAVAETQLEGKYVMLVPKLGWVAIGIRNFFDMIF